MSQTNNTATNLTVSDFANGVYKLCCGRGAELIMEHSLVAGTCFFFPGYIHIYVALSGFCGAYVRLSIKVNLLSMHRGAL